MCIADPVLQKKMVLLFNDVNRDSVARLERNISKLPGYDTLMNKPNYSSQAIDQGAAQEFQKVNLVPTFSFVDPWGYDGLTYDLISALIKDWGSDCIFYFNYRRINMAIVNPYFQDHMKALFGEQLLEEVRAAIKGMNPLDREHYILNALGALFDQSGLYTVPFRFQCEDRDQTSHYIIFVSKHPLAYTVMKDIMAGQSTSHDDDCAGFEYVPVENPQLSFLYKYALPMSELRAILLRKYKGRRVSVIDIFYDTHVGTPFILKNFKSTLLELLDEGLVSVENPDGNLKVRKNSMADQYIVTF